MKNVETCCPFCGTKKMAGYLCPECGRSAGAILKVEDVSNGFRYWRTLSEHRDFDAAYMEACKMFDGGLEEDFLISDNIGPDMHWPDVRIPGYKLVKEPCGACGKETRAFDMIRTVDCHGIPYRRVCQKCYEQIMEEKGYDGERYDERDENLDADY